MTRAPRRSKKERYKLGRRAGVVGDAQVALESDVLVGTVAEWRRKAGVAAKSKRVTLVELAELESEGNAAIVVTGPGHSRNVRWSPRLHKQIFKAADGFVNNHGSKADHNYLDAARHFLPCYAATQYLRDHKQILHEHILKTCGTELTVKGTRVKDVTGTEYELAINNPTYSWDDEALREEILIHLGNQPTVEDTIREAAGILASGKYYSPGLRAAGVNQFERDEDGNLMYMQDYVAGEPRIEPETHSDKFTRTSRAARQELHSEGLPQVLLPSEHDNWSVDEMLALERELSAAEDRIKEHITSHERVLTSGGANFRVDDPDDRAPIGVAHGGGRPRGWYHDAIAAQILEQANGDTRYAAELVVNTKCNGSYKTTGLKSKLNIDADDYRRTKSPNLIIRAVDDR